MPPRLLPALPGTLSSPGNDRQECPWMEKAGTASSPSQGHTNLQAGWHKYCMVNCCVSCLFVCVLRKIVLFSKSLLYLNLAFGPPSYSSSLPCTVLSILSYLHPLIMPSLTRFPLFHPLMFRSANLWKGEGEEKEAETRREVFQVLLRPSLT